MKNAIKAIARLIFSQELAEQVYRTEKAFGLVVIIGILIGVGYGYQTDSYFVKYGLGPTSGALAVGLSWELIPLITALVVVARIGVSYAAEISSMKISQQIDALRTLAVNPWRYLVLPRFIACVVMVPVLTVFAVFACFGGEYLAAQLMKVNMESFMNLAKSTFCFSYLIRGIIKAVIFGAAISLNSCYCGFSIGKDKENALGVGQAANRAVVSSFLVIFLINFCFSFI